MAKNISEYFKDPKSGKCLDKKVIRVLINSFTDDKKASLLEELKDDLYTLKKDKVSKRIYIILYRLKKIIENLTTENIYEMNPDDLIALYLEHYPQNITKFF